ncbi:MAG: peptidoglycan-binding protein LysM [Lysobacteraceae bacterium]|nr:MAG: peptidoglycan-binding protein LysM [Xanthomonadaceae bacterium]
MLKKLLAIAAVAALTFGGWVMAVELRADHPDTYVVKKGDTLWDIAARFLKEPWLWPEIWHANPQIANPHLIYPGDVISLAYLSGGRPALGITKRSPQVRREAIDPIQAVPLSDIEGFLTRTRVIGDEEREKLPYVIGLEEGRLRSASGQLVYIRGGDFRAGDEVAFLRPSVRFAVHPQPATGYPRLKRDPWNMRDGLDPQVSGIEWAYYAASDNGFEVLGWELVEVAKGKVMREGDPASVLLSAEGREVKQGDVVMPVENMPFDLSFMPHPPKSVPEHLRILAVTDRAGHAGPRDVVAISAGARDGIDNGTVFAIYHPGEKIKDEVRHGNRIAASLPGNQVQMPAEFVGHVMVFRTFEKVSYGLIMDGIRPARLEDELRHPGRL